MEKKYIVKWCRFDHIKWIDSKMFRNGKKKQKTVSSAGPFLFVPLAFEINFIIWTFEKFVWEKNEKSKGKKTPNGSLSATCSIECWM